MLSVADECAMALNTTSKLDSRSVTRGALHDSNTSVSYLELVNVLPALAHGPGNDRDTLIVLLLGSNETFAYERGGSM